MIINGFSSSETTMKSDGTTRIWTSGKAAQDNSIEGMIGQWPRGDSVINLLDESRKCREVWIIKDY